MKKNMEVDDFCEFKYSVQDFCYIFGINTNTFPSIAHKLDLNKFSKMYENDYRALKRYYNKEAYDILLQYYNYKKENKKIKHNIIALELEQKIKNLENENQNFKKEIEKIKNSANQVIEPDTRLSQELEEKQKTIDEKNEKIEKLEAEKKKLLSENLSYRNQMIENQNQINELSNRSFKDFLKKKK